MSQQLSDYVTVASIMWGKVPAFLLVLFLVVCGILLAVYLLGEIGRK